MVRIEGTIIFRSSDKSGLAEERTGYIIDYALSGQRSLLFVKLQAAGKERVLDVSLGEC